VLLKKAANIASRFGQAQHGQGRQGHQEAARSRSQDQEGRPQRQQDEAAIKMIAGTARNMGIDVVD
jgi:ribosomal protein L11